MTLLMASSAFGLGKDAGVLLNGRLILPATLFDGTETVHIFRQFGTVVFYQNAMFLFYTSWAPGTTSFSNRSARKPSVEVAMTTLSNKSDIGYVK